MTNYDGDTITVIVDGWPRIIGEMIPIRVRGIDAPEIRGKCLDEKLLAYSAKSFVNNELSNADKIIIRNPIRGKYFRIVGDVEYDGKDLAVELMSHGFGYVYDGGTKTNPWCK